MTTDLLFNIDSMGNKISVNSSNWRDLVSKYSNQSYDIVNGSDKQIQWVNKIYHEIYEIARLYSIEDDVIFNVKNARFWIDCRDFLKEYILRQIASKFNLRHIPSFDLTIIEYGIILGNITEKDLEDISDLPFELDGSIKQVQWATKIIKQAICVANKLGTSIVYNTNASFWIDNRDKLNLLINSTSTASTSTASTSTASTSTASTSVSTNKSTEIEDEIPF